jgi:hypothetical protein
MNLLSLTVACPVCKAPIGKPCKRPRSRPGSHAERIRVAEGLPATVLHECIRCGKGMKKYGAIWRCDSCGYSPINAIPTNYAPNYSHPSHDEDIPIKTRNMTRGEIK